GSGLVLGLHFRVLFEGLQCSVHPFQIGFGLGLVTRVARLVEVLGELGNPLHRVFDHFLVVGMCLGWQSFRQVANRERMVMNVSQLFRFHRVGELLMVLVNLLPNPFHCVRDFDFFAAFLVLLMIFVFLSQEDCLIV